MKVDLHVRIERELHEALTADADKRGLNLADVVTERLSGGGASKRDAGEAATLPVSSATGQGPNAESDLGPAGTVYEVQALGDRRVLIAKKDWVGLPDRLKAAKARNELLVSQLAVERQRNAELRNGALRKGNVEVGDRVCSVAECPISAQGVKFTQNGLLAHYREYHPERFVTR